MKKYYEEIDKMFKELTESNKESNKALIKESNKELNKESNKRSNKELIKTISPKNDRIQQIGMMKISLIKY